MNDQRQPTMFRTPEHVKRDRQEQWNAGRIARLDGDPCYSDDPYWMDGWYSVPECWESKDLTNKGGP